MTDKLEIQSVMTPFPEAIDCSQTLREAKEMMREHGVRHLPVIRSGELCGLLSHRDIHFTLATEKKSDYEVLVDTAYSPDPYVVEVNTSVELAAQHMADDRVGCALVVEDDRLVGIFTSVDACRTLAKLLREK